MNKSCLQIYKNKISQGLLNKLTKAGINKQILQQTFQKNGREGIRILLWESVNVWSQILGNKKILNKVYDLFPNEDTTTIWYFLFTMCGYT